MGWLTSLTSFFVNPAMVLPGVALASAPVIIHLINRMRYRKIRFAAMEFLFASQKRNRRRLLLEQLLLLLMRILLVLLIMFLLARLVLDPEKMSLFRGAKTHHVVLLDDSGSMREQIGETSAFLASVEIVQKLVSEGRQRPDSQKLTLILLSNPTAPLVNQENINDELETRLETRLENLVCTHQHFDLTNGLQVAADLLANDTESIKHLHVISDFRRRDWSDEDAISKRVAALGADDVTVNLVKVVPKQNNNIAITTLDGSLRVAAASVPITFRVGVTNYGETTIAKLSVSVFADGTQISKSVELSEIEPGQEEIGELEVSFNTPGRHSIKVSTDVDTLSQDNERYLVFDLPSELPVLVVDGAGGSDASRNLVDALEAGDCAYKPETQDPTFLRKFPLDKFRTVYMLNVGILQPDAVDRLQEYVAGGGGLVWFMGDRIEDNYYVAELYKNQQRFGDRIGLFPAPLGETAVELSRPEFTNPGADLAFEPISIFAKFKEYFRSSYFNVIRIKKYYPLRADWSEDDKVRKDGVQTIARLRNNKPLCLVHEFGEGTIVTFLTGADDEWNNWTGDPAGLSFLATIHDMQKQISSRVGVSRQRMVGEPIHAEIDLTKYSKTVEIVAPGAPPVALEAGPKDADSTDLVDAGSMDAKTSDDTSKTDSAKTDSDSDSAPKTAKSNVYFANYADTDFPGVYSIKLTTLDRETEETTFAFNVPPEESELKLADTDDIRKVLGDEATVQIQEPGNFSWLEGKEADQEIRHFLLACLMFFLLAEQLLAYKLSYHPKSSGTDT